MIDNKKNMYFVFIPISGTELLKILEFFKVIKVIKVSFSMLTK